MSTPRCALAWPRCTGPLAAGWRWDAEERCWDHADTPPVSAAPEATRAPLVGDHGRTTAGGAR